MFWDEQTLVLPMTHMNVCFSQHCCSRPPKDPEHTSFLEGSPASDPAMKARLKDVRSSRQTDGLD